MTCNFCKWDTLFDAHQQEQHSRSCEEYKRAAELDDERWRKLSKLAHNPASGDPDCSVDEIMFELETVFQAIQVDRWYRIKLLRGQLDADWTHFWQQYQDWRQTVEAKASQLRAKKRTADAQHVVKVLLTDRAFDYGQFTIHSRLPFGEETLTLRGLDPLRLQTAGPELPVGASTSDATMYRPASETVAGNCLATEPPPGLQELRLQHAAAVMELKSQHAAALEAQRAQSHATLLHERKEHNAAVKDIRSQQTGYRRELERERKFLECERKEHQKTAKKLTQQSSAASFAQKQLETARSLNSKAQATRWSQTELVASLRGDLREAHVNNKKMAESYSKALFDLDASKNYASKLNEWAEKDHARLAERQLQDMRELEKKLRGQYDAALAEQAEAAAAETSAYIANIEEDRDQLLAQRTRSEAELAIFQTKLSDVSRERDTLRSSIEQSAHTDIAACLARTAEVVEDRNRLRIHLERYREREAGWQAQAGDDKTERDKLRGELAACQARTREVEEDKEKRCLCPRLEKELAASQARSAQLEDEGASLRSRLDQAGTEAKALAEEMTEERTAVCLHLTQTHVMHAEAVAALEERMLQVETDRGRLLRLLEQGKQECI